jgi:hypothetical protein
MVADTLSSLSSVSRLRTMMGLQRLLVNLARPTNHKQSALLLLSRNRLHPHPRRRRYAGCSPR